jgi:hypothetical protein
MKPKKKGTRSKGGSVSSNDGDPSENGLLINKNEDTPV